MSANFSLSTAASSPAIPFVIHTLQWMEANRDDTLLSKHIHSFGVVLIRKGSGMHLVDMERYEIGENRVCCLAPGQVHAIATLGAVDGYFISFSREFFYRGDESLNQLFPAGLLQTFLRSPVLCVSEETMGELIEIAERMVREYGNYFLMRQEIIRGFLKIFLIYLSREAGMGWQQGYLDRKNDLVQQFFDLLDRHFTTYKRVTDYAREQRVSANYLNELVKQLTGFTASHHIRQRIILQAKRMATYSNLTMKEVAYSLGFDDIAHFSKFFKNFSGVSFREFKKGLHVVDAD